MKSIIALMLLALATQASAEKFLEQPNKAGGKMILTTDVCPGSPSLRRMMSTVPNGKTMLGCWGYISGEIHVRYDDGDLYTYSKDAFTYVDTDEAPQPAPKGKNKGAL